MKIALPSLAAALLLAACTTTTAPPAPSTAQPSPSAAQPPSSAQAQPAGDGFEAAFKAAGLTKLDIKPLERTMTHDSPGAPTVQGRRVTMFVTGGIKAQPIELAKDASGRVVRVVREPVETVKETVVEGCEKHVFAGGRAWFDRVVIELPEGATWGGEVTVKYPTVREVLKYTGKTSDGKPCPPPERAMD